jgi:hypothetical protein
LGISILHGKVKSISVEPFPDALEALRTQLGCNAGVAMFFDAAQWAPPTVVPFESHFPPSSYSRPLDPLPAVQTLASPDLAPETVLLSSEGAVDVVVGPDVALASEGVMRQGVHYVLLPGSYLVVDDPAAKFAVLPADTPRVLVVLRRVLRPPGILAVKGHSAGGQAALASVPVALSVCDSADNLPASRTQSHLHTPAIEAAHVHQVYDTIAAHWDRTRFGQLWKHGHCTQQQLTLDNQTHSLAAGENVY